MAGKKSITNPPCSTSAHIYCLDKQTRNMILTFQGKEHMFSNMHPSIVLYKGNLFPSAEHVYQYTKAMYARDDRMADQIKQARSPFKAKAIARSIDVTLTLPQTLFSINILAWPLGNGVQYS